MSAIQVTYRTARVDVEADDIVECGINGDVVIDSTVFNPQHLIRATGQALGAMDVLDVDGVRVALTNLESLLEGVQGSI